MSIKSIIKNPLFGGSAMMVIGSNVANAVAYLYHVIVGRMLGPSSYGELSAVISVLGLLFTSFNFLGLVVVKFVSSAKESEIGFIFDWFSKKANKAGFLVGILIAMVSPILGNFLHVDLSVVLLIVPIVFFAFLTFIYRSFAQGLLKFWEVVISTNIDLVVRLIFAILFIALGFSVFGAVLGMVISMIASFVYLKKSISRFIVKGKIADLKFASKVFKYSIPILFATLATNSIFTTDVILVKHYFNAHDAGIYASLSTLGRIIFYGAGPVSAVMFPMIAKRYSLGQKIDKIFFLSFIMTLVISTGVLGIFYFFPELAIKILFGSEYLDGKDYLPLFGVFMTLFALASLIFNFFLSIEKVSVVYISVVSSIAQITGIVFWHKNILQVITVSIYCAFFFLVALIVYYLYDTRYAKAKI